MLPFDAMLDYPRLLAVAALASLAMGQTPQTPQAPAAPTRADILRGEYDRYRANNDLLSYALDVRVDRIWTFDRWRLSAYLDVQNVYNRANPEGWDYNFDYRERARLTGLPILPMSASKELCSLRNASSKAI